MTLDSSDGVPIRVTNEFSEKRFFQVDVGTCTLIGDLIPKSSPPRVLILHGAGNSHRGDYRLFREQLLIHGISSVAFDFVGHGDTGGELKSSNLLSRTRQACSVVDSLNIQQPFSVIAASMGAYTAVKLLEFYQIKSLVLLVPAMYTSMAYTVPFNAGFTDIIRQPESWGHSDAWDILSGYRGRLLIIAAENDKVIPKGVINKIYDSAVNAKERELFVAPRASHFVFTDLRSNNPDGFCKVLAQIVEMLKNRA
jgi:pimeloyl-ACP methyl ester carboxylesterase